MYTRQEKEHNRSHGLSPTLEGRKREEERAKEERGEEREEMRRTKRRGREGEKSARHRANYIEFHLIPVPVWLRLPFQWAIRLFGPSHASHSVTSCLSKPLSISLAKGVCVFNSPAMHHPKGERFIFPVLFTHLHSRPVFYTLFTSCESHTSNMELATHRRHRHTQEWGAVKSKWKMWKNKCVGCRDRRWWGREREGERDTWQVVKNQSVTHGKEKGKEWKQKGHHTHKAYIKHTWRWGKSKKCQSA